MGAEVISKKNRIKMRGRLIENDSSAITCWLKCRRYFAGFSVKNLFLLRVIVSNEQLNQLTIKPTDNQVTIN